MDAGGYGRGGQGAKGVSGGGVEVRPARTIKSLLEGRLGSEREIDRVLDRMAQEAELGVGDSSTEDEDEGERERMVRRR